MSRYAHAVVLGGSIAGLLTAAALHRSFAQVTIVDRDALAVDPVEGPRPRRGVPHGEQVHHLLKLGHERMESLLPGLTDELLALGCERYDDVADFSQYVNGAWRMRVRSDLTVTMFRRPLFEWAIRRRVLALPGVSVVKGLAIGLTGADGRVTGAKVRGVDGGEVPADLVVDATGRGSRAPHWIEDLGFAAPEERHVRIDVGYSTYTVRLAEGAMPKGLAGIAVSATPANPIGAAVRPCGNGLHDVQAYGMLGHHPPDDFDGIAAYFAGLSSPIIATVLAGATVTSEIAPYRMPGNQRRMWEDLERRPERFVVVGDAVTSFNPIYGQGMTMAALGATLVGEAVESSESLDGVASLVQAAIAPRADVAWNLAVGLDSAYPQAEYENVAPPDRRAREWSRAYAAAQTAEGAVRVANRATALYLDTSYVDSPTVSRIVDDWLAAERTPDPAVTDALDPPSVTDGLVRAADLVAGVGV